DCGAWVTSSSTVSGRAEANSAASTSFASGLTADLNRGERPLLMNVQRAALGELEQGDEGGQDVHDRRTFPHDVAPPEHRTFREQRLNPLGRALHVERSGHYTVQHRLGNEADNRLPPAGKTFQVNNNRRGRRNGRLGGKPPPDLLPPPRARPPHPSHDPRDLLIPNP